MTNLERITQALHAHTDIIEMSGDEPVFGNNIMSKVDEVAITLESVFNEMVLEAVEDWINNN